MQKKTNIRSKKTRNNIQAHQSYGNCRTRRMLHAAASRSKKEKESQVVASQPASLFPDFHRFPMAVKGEESLCEICRLVSSARVENKGFSFARIFILRHWFCH
ncbi:hypothetical protein CDAR_37861 [Caerostris darwini]|uniref:Uncharacterized protein n=1 Tax=Caerostris darwini TaxID=1538125 RepID=A0AAV4T7L8_9ARAC|nr:hypothetical protein CDAR_37861 [Caerostris darwini]